MAAGIAANNISVVDRAKVPEMPSSPNHMLNFLAALILGAIVGAGLAMLMEQIDEGITEPTDLPRILNVPLLGVVPTIALAVVVDALFALWGAWLKGEAND